MVRSARNFIVDRFLQGDRAVLAYLAVYTPCTPYSPLRLWDHRMVKDAKVSVVSKWGGRNGDASLPEE
jgi:hypothetical protein